MHYPILAIHRTRGSRYYYDNTRPHVDRNPYAPGLRCRALRPRRNGVNGKALQRTLEQFFYGTDGRCYLKGNAEGAFPVVGDAPATDLRRQVPSSMKANAADLLRKALAGSTNIFGYKTSPDRFKTDSLPVDGEDLVVDVDADLGVK